MVLFVFVVMDFVLMVIKDFETLLFQTQNVINGRTQKRNIDARHSVLSLRGMVQSVTVINQNHYMLISQRYVTVQNKIGIP